MARLSACVLLGAGTVASGFRSRSKKHVAKESEVEEPAPGVQNSIGDLPPLGEIILDPKDFASCHLSESACPIDEMTEPTLVYTDDDNSVCWNGDKFAFLVRPGARDKLLFFLPGGGACYEMPVLLPGAAPTCFTDFRMALTATGFGLGGVMDVENPKNAFKDFTIVSPPYCSGGAHIANTTVKSATGNTQYSYGYNNNNYAITWAQRNLKPSLKNFVIMGSSAGSLGTTVWSDFLLGVLTYEKATVIMDSYMAVFPEDTQGPIVKNFGACNLPILQNAKAKCEAGEFYLQDFQEAVIARYPKVAFTHVQCKSDVVQRAFYKTVALAYFRPDFYITERSFYRETNDMMQRYSKHPNYVAYYIDGWFHTFSQWNFWYSASVAGQSSDPPAGTPLLWEWVVQLVNHEPVSSQCNGPLKPNGWYLLTNNNYCDEKVFPKTLSLGR